MFAIMFGSEPHLKMVVQNLEASPLKCGIQNGLFSNNFMTPSQLKRTHISQTN